MVLSGEIMSSEMSNEMSNVLCLMKMKYSQRNSCIKYTLVFHRNGVKIILRRHCVAAGRDF